MTTDVNTISRRTALAHDAARRAGALRDELVEPVEPQRWLGELTCGLGGALRAGAGTARVTAATTESLLELAGVALAYAEAIEEERAR